MLSLNILSGESGSSGFVRGRYRGMRLPQGNNSPMPGCGQSSGQGLSEMNGFASRGCGLRVERVNNRGRSNDRGMGQG